MCHTVLQIADIKKNSVDSCTLYNIMPFAKIIHMSCKKRTKDIFFTYLS